MRRYTLALVAMIAGLLVLYGTAGSAEAQGGKVNAASPLETITAPVLMSATINGWLWTDPISKSDTDGNGTLKLTYRKRLGNYSDGMYIEGVTISAAGGGITYQGAGGKGASCWGEQNNIQWSAGAAATSLRPGQFKSWDLEIMMVHSDRAVCSWFFQDEFVPGSDVNRCAKVLVKHNDDNSTGGCG